MHRKLSSVKSPPPLGIVGSSHVGRSFGRCLDDQPSADACLPVVLTACCDYIRCNLASEGLFRVEGSKVRQRDLKARLERGLPIKDGTPVQDVSSLLKLWLRELPEPLLPPRLASALAEASPLERRVRLLRLLNRLMPPRQLAALRHLCQLLRAVAATSAVNRMTAANLATCLGPSLHGGGGSPDVARLNAAVALLIEFAPDIGADATSTAAAVAAVPAIDDFDEAAVAALQTPPTTPQPEEPQEPQPRKLLRRRSSGSLTSAFRAVGRAVSRLASRSRSRSPRRLAAAAAAASACDSPASIASTSATASASSSGTTATAASADKPSVGLLASFRFDPAACHTPVIGRCRRQQSVILVGKDDDGCGNVDAGLCFGRRRRRLLLERISAGRKASVDLCSLGSPLPAPPPPPRPAFRLQTPPPVLPQRQSQIQQPQQMQQQPQQSVVSVRTPLRRLQRSPRDSLHVLRQARRNGGGGGGGSVPRRPDRLRGVRRLWSPLRLTQNARLCLLRAEGLRPA